MVITAHDVAFFLYADDSVQHKLTVRPFVQRKVIFFEFSFFLLEYNGILTVTKHWKHTRSRGYEVELLAVFERLFYQRLDLGHWQNSTQEDLPFEAFR
jgi:hypothetical protein